MTQVNPPLGAAHAIGNDPAVDAQQAATGSDPATDAAPAATGNDPAAAWHDPAAILHALDHALSAPAKRDNPLRDLDQAQAILETIVQLRRARGEMPRGYKIGFTNRTIWPIYNVHHPIWGPVYDSTVVQVDSASARVDVSRFVLPRAEPEIIFGLARSPASDQPEDLIAAIDWYAHGFEIVQCPYPEWRMSAAEAIAAQSLHAALYIGPHRPLAELADPVAQLAGLRLDLFEHDRAIASGRGADVLDSPLLALGHLVRELARYGRSLSPGDIVTTGTLTDAQPLHPGQAWASVLTGVPLAGFRLTTTTENA